MGHRRRWTLAACWIAATLSVAAGSLAAEAPQNGWTFHSQTNEYQARVSGSVVAFADCKSEDKGSNRPYEAPFVVFPPQAIAELLKSGALPMVEVRSRDKIIGQHDVLAIVPDEAVRSFWIVKTGFFYRPEIEEMAAADHLSISLGGWARGAVTIYDSVFMPDEGRKDVLDRVAKQCF